jgi:hypothetical protein
MSTPTVFISSTIFDFKDLRSAIHYFLTSRGFSVLLSEYNDFPGSNCQNSYDECLSAISKSDYFILLIGARVGGLYSANPKKSITRMEYEIAYDHLSSRGLKIIPFVRKEIWTIREDRKTLESYLSSVYSKTRELPANEIADIIKHPSKFLNDAETIFDFINLIVRHEEMIKAAQGKSTLPKGNWIYQFDIFADIATSLIANMRIDVSLNEKILRKNLRDELVSNLAILHSKHKSKISPITQWTEPFRDWYSIPKENYITVKAKHVLWMLLGTFQLTGLSKNISTRLITRCIDEGLFLRYDLSSSTYLSTDHHLALCELLVNANRLREASSSINISMLREKYLEDAKSDGESDIEISGFDFAFVVLASDRVDDIINLSIAMIKYIDGFSPDISKIKRKPTSPIEGMDEQMASENVNFEEMQEYLKIF